MLVTNRNYLLGLFPILLIELMLDDTGLGGWEGLLLPEGEGLGALEVNGKLGFDPPELETGVPVFAVDGCWLIPGCYRRIRV